MSVFGKLGEQLAGALGDVQEKAKKAVEKVVYREQSGIDEPKTDSEKVAKGVGTAFGGIKKALAPLGEAFAPAISAVKQGNAKRREEDLRLQTEEEAKREERKKAGTFDGTASFGILSKWFEDDIKAGEKMLQQKEKEQERALKHIKELEGPTRLANHLVSVTMQEYKRTGTEEARQRYERSQKSANEYNQKYSAALGLYEVSYGEYEGAVNSYNKTVQEANSYYERERAAREEWIGTGRKDVAEIEKDLKAAEDVLRLYEDQRKEADLDYYNAYEDEIKREYEAWRAAGGTEADIGKLDLVKKQDLYVWFYLMHENISGAIEAQQQKVRDLKTEHALAYTEREDFEQTSAYKSTANGKEPKWSNSFGEIYYSETGYDDIVYEYINKNPEAVHIVDVQDSGNERVAGMDRAHLKEMTEQEVAIFNSIYTEDKERAYKWVRELEPNLKARLREIEREEWSEYARHNKVEASVFSTLLAPAQIIPTIVQVADYLDDGKIDTNDGYNRLANIKTDIRQAAGEDMNGFWRWVYNTGMSGADSVVNMVASGFYAPMQMVFSFGNVAAGTVIESKQKGLSDKKAIAKGFAVGVVEALTERMGIDALLKVKSAETLGRYLRRVAAANGLEEGVANLGEFAADILIAREKSEFNQEFKKYKEAGLKDGAAFAKAICNQLGSAALDALGGALIGFGMAGGTAGIKAGVNAIGKGVANKIELADATRQQIEAQDIAREKAAQRAQITLVTAQNTGATGHVLPTAKDTMAVRENRTNTNATAMDTMTDEEYNARMDIEEAEASMAGQSMLYDDGRQFVIKKTEGNQNFVEVEGDILQGVPKKQWVRTVKDTLKKKFPQGVTIRNDTIKINAKTRGEITNSEYTRWIADHSAQKYADKLRATNNADEIIEAASNWTGEAPLHDRTDNIVEFARGDVLMRIGKNGYSADVVVATTKDGSMLLYDIVNMEPTVIKEKSQTQTAATPLAGISDRTSAFSSNDNIPQTSAFSQENSARNPFGENVLPTAEELDRQRRAANAETETERTGILLGVPEWKIQTAKRLSKIIGKEIIFYRNTDGKVKNDLGFYDHETGRICINADAENPIAVILGHEMIHDIQLTDGYIKFFKTVFRKMQADGINISKARAELKARYAENGVNLDTTAKVDQDLVAEYAQEHLFTDEESIASIVNADQESGRKIANFLDGILAKLGDKDAQERVFVAKARALYAKALRENKAMESAGEYQSETASAETKTSGMMAGQGDAHSTAMDDRTIEGRAVEAYGNESENTVEDSIRQTLRPEIASNTALMHMLEEQFGEAGIKELALQIKAEIERTGSLGRFATLFTDGGMAVREALDAESVSHVDGRQFMVGDKDGLEKSGETEYNVENMPTIPTKPGKTFPSDKTSQSEAHRLAIDWAHREDVQNGDRAIIYYHGGKYAIEKDDNTYFRYTIVRKLTKKGYLYAKQYYEEVGTDETYRARQRGTEGIFSNSAEDREYDGDRAMGSRNDSLPGTDGRGAGDVETASRGAGRGAERAEDITRGVENQQDRGTVHPVGRGRGRGGIGGEDTGRQYAIAKEKEMLSEDGTKDLIESGEKAGKISVNMSEDSRYEVLKNKRITPTKAENIDAANIDFPYLENNIKSTVEKGLLKKFQELGLFKTYRSIAVGDIAFDFTGKGFRKSIHSQENVYGGSKADFAKVLLNLQSLLDASVLIEMHADKGKGTDKEKRGLDKVYVLFSAFDDGGQIIPVQFEIEQYIGRDNRLYLAVALTKIETGVKGNMASDKQKATSLVPVSDISISEIFAKINPSDKNFLKYIPNQFLDAEQIAAKEEALEADRKKYMKSDEDGRQYAIAKDGEETETRQDGERADFWDEWLEKVKEYGEMPQGEKPARDIKVPKKIATDKPVSQTVRTILEAKVTPEEAIPTIEQLVLDGDFTYTVYTDKQAIRDATSKIQTRGYAAAFGTWMQDVEKGKVSKENTALGWALYNQAATNGDIKTAMTILNKMVEHQRNAAQALQATRILKQLSPEGQLYQAVNSVEALQEELNEKYGKKAPVLKIDEEFAEELLQARTQKERDAAKKKIYQDIGKQMPSRFIDKWNAWRYLAMLGNPRTHIRNIIGNAGFAPVVLAKDLTATAIEGIVHRVSGGKTTRSKAILTGSKYDRALLKAAWADYQNVAEVVSGGGKYNDAANANRSIEEGRQVFKSIVLEKARKGNSALLELEDVWFSRPHYALALAQYCKANNISAERIANGRAIESARVYAIKEAQKATYKDTNAFSQMVSGWGRNRSTNDTMVKKAFNTAVEGSLPFRKTPANILVRGFEYSPLGLLKGLSADLVQVKNGKMTAAEAIDNISAGLTGTGLLALGVYLAAEGLIRGHGGEDEDEKEFMETMGHQAYALELSGGTSITLDWLAPEALPFFVGVNLWEMTKGKGETVNLSAILTSISTVTEPMLEMSCLQSLNDLFESVGYASSEGLDALPTILSSATTSYLTQALPTILGQGERSGEKERMTTYTGKNSFLTGDMQYTLGKASAKIPGIDYNQIPYIDAWGRKEEAGGAGSRIANNFLNPAYTSKVNTSKMEEELLRLYNATGEDSVFPQRAKKYFTVDGDRKDLTAEEYVKYATLKGQESYKVITKLTESRAYNALDDAEKAKAIEEAYTYADQKAKKAVGGYKPESWIQKADASGTPIETNLAFRASVGQAREENGGEISKASVVDILSDMALSSDDTWALYLTMYDSSGDRYAHDNGVSGGTYLDFVDALKAVDGPTESGKYGTYTQEEAEKAVRKMTGLTRQDKAVLWQSVN